MVLLTTFCHYILHHLATFLDVRDIARLHGTCRYLSHVFAGPKTFFGSRETTDPSLALIQFNLFTNVVTTCDHDTVILYRLKRQRVHQEIWRWRFSSMVRGIDIYLICMFVLLQDGRLYYCSLRDFQCHYVMDNIYSFALKQDFGDMTQSFPRHANRNYLTLFTQVRNPRRVIRPSHTLIMDCVRQRFELEAHHIVQETITSDDDDENVCTHVDVLDGTYTLTRDGAVFFNDRKVLSCLIDKIRLVSQCLRRKVYALCFALRKVYLLEGGKIKFTRHFEDSLEDVVFKRFSHVALHCDNTKKTDIRVSSESIKYFGK